MACGIADRWTDIILGSFYCIGSVFVWCLEVETWTGLGKQ